MTKTLLAAGAALLAAGAANAQTATKFEGGLSSPAPGHSVVYDFDKTGLQFADGDKVKILGGFSSEGAAPPFANPGGNYLSVLGGGLAKIDFDRAVGAFSFDWGSIDGYNTLKVFLSGGGVQQIANPGVGNGAQGGAVNNGRFTVTGTGGSRITGFSLESSANSFEIDNVAIAGAVPEPATWGLMILGVGGIGGMMRRRRAVAGTVRFA